MDEIWKDIKGYEGEYQVSNLGRVKSLPRYVACGKNGNGTRLVSERILKTGAYTKSGHVSVVLRKNGNGQPVHKLVMEAFVGKRPNGLDICHNDGNPQNNVLENLRYDTRSSNNIDIFRHGGHMGCCKLNEQKVKKIRKLVFDEKVSRAEVARKFKVSARTVQNICKGKTFKWVGVE